MSIEGTGAGASRGRGRVPSRKISGGVTPEILLFQCLLTRVKMVYFPTFSKLGKWPKSEEKLSFAVGGFGYLNSSAQSKPRGDALEETYTQIP